QLSGDEIIGAESGLKNVMDMVHQVAPRDNPVLLLGETGVGKEVIANAIHYSSPRKDGPFIKVNSGAIPEGLIDSELFGHEKGAFTGALNQKRGRFERAHGGTIFLDEIGDLPMQAQSRLLRVIQQKELERVGGTKTIQVDTRIIAATHRNLEQMVAKNKFREDLWYRLSIFPIIIPPLRQRKSDIPELVEHFLKRKSRELNLHGIPPIVPGAIDRLIDYQWKGNVRELENMVERALIQYNGGFLNFGHFIVSQVQDTPILSSTDGRMLTLCEVNVRHIQKALEATHGKINGPEGAARILGIHPSTLRCKMDKLGIKYGKKTVSVH
ncbi:MAG: AAA family ATPase, partial [Desulfobacterium sp.]|nr:AAA family ATPase [Desulfobacterium sp.]